MARCLLLALGVSGQSSYVTDPIARHTACAVQANSPTVCILSGHVTAPSNGILERLRPSLNQAFGRRVTTSSPCRKRACQGPDRAKTSISTL